MLNKIQILKNHLHFADKAATLYYSRKRQKDEYMTYEDMRYCSILAMCVEASRFGGDIGARQTLSETDLVDRLRFVSKRGVRLFLMTPYRLRSVSLPGGTTLRLPLPVPDHPKFNYRYWVAPEVERCQRLWNAPDDDPELQAFAEAFIKDQGLLPYLEPLICANQS